MAFGIFVGEEADLGGARLVEAIKVWKPIKKSEC